ncbi:MAG: DUF4382 domain-containing protein [Terriglobia bacterium]
MFNGKPRQIILLCITAVLLIASGWIISCGGNSTTSSSTPAMTGAITTTLTDPPVCTTNYDHVWVTVTKVTANISSTAADTDGGWVTLVDLTSGPQQIDLLSLASPTCTLKVLGSTTGLLPGKYQQIRLYLLSNTATSGPSPNNCGNNNGFNCVVPHNSTPQELLLSSEAQSGLKIPPGQIAGGGITLTAGQSADLSINFDACASILKQGNGQYRLKPTLNAGVVSVNSNSISGKVVDSNSNPIANAVVLLEQPDAAGIDRVIDAGVSASDGTFFFCPVLPGSNGGKVDVVVDATTTTALVTTVYGATVALNVPIGTALNNIPLVSEGTGTALTIPWSTITGQVTSTNSGVATVADITLSPLQSATAGGSTVLVTVPAFAVIAQPPTFTTSATPNPSTPVCPAGTDCSNYTLMVPSGNPQVGAFSSGSISYAAPAAPPVTYSLNATTGNCTTSTPSPATVGSITVTPAATTNVSTVLAFSGCTAP